MMTRFLPVWLGRCVALWAVFCFGAPISAARTIVATGAATQWRYWDRDETPGANWRLPGFDDSRWKSGPAPLGFGEPRLGTEIAGGLARARRVTTWFRHEFLVPELRTGEQMILLHSVDDGAIFYLDGREIGRTNLPGGAVQPTTYALKTIGNNEEGFYRRLPILPGSLTAGGKCVLAVEVHQASAESSDLYFDAALKVLPAPIDEAGASATARELTERFHRQHYLGPDEKIPDGYFDGGRRMKVDAGGNAASGREILLVNRVKDEDLAADLAFARSAELRALPQLERVRKLVERIDREMTPPGGERWLDEQVEQLEQEFTSKPVLLGTWVDQSQAGVCRHRALLFKVLADEADLRVALVRGNFSRRGPPGYPHVWNEVVLDGGQRVLVDVMLNEGKATFPPVNDPQVVARYLKVDDTPWYTAR